MAYRHERFRDPGLHDAVQLFVKYIPLEFDENCLYELFMEYGEVTNVHIPEKAYMLGHEYLFGFVSYLTTDEALDAINALNGKAPYYISVEVSRQATVELLRDQTHAFHSAPKCTEVVPTFRRHSNIGCNYKLTTTPDGKRVIQGIHSGVPRRSVPFGDRNSAVVRDLSEEDDVPAPGQKQKFPCYKCGNLTFRKCVCGGAYYCKEACRMSDWPEHKQNCIKKLESQPDFQAGASTGFLQNRSINIEMQKTHLSSRHLKTESFNNTVGQLENGLQSEQRENLSHNLGHRQPRFPAVNNFADSQIEVAGVRNNGKRHSRFPICDLDVQNEISADKKENSNKGSLNVAVNKDGDNRRNFNQRDGDNGRNLNQRDGDNGRNLDQHDGDNKRNLDQRDGDKRRNLDQRNGDIRRNFDQRNGDNRRNFDQRNGDNRRNFIQRDGDNRRNFIQRDGDNRRNFIQRDGDNRRNFNQHDGDKNKFGDGNARKNFVARDQKSFSGGMNKKKINDCKGKYLDGSVPTNNTESEECWGQPEEDVSQKVEEKQDNLVDKHGKIQDTVVEADDKTSHLALSSSENLTAEVAKVMVVMKEGPTTYFVQRLANKETLKIICSEIIKSPSLPLVKPEVGVLCASMFEGEWYRARVLMLDPQLAVQYVDYGNVDICDPTKLHELPQSIAGFPPMAEKVEFDDKTPAEVCAELFDGAIISIKLTGKTENGALKVTKDNGNNAVLAIQNSSASLSQDDSAKDAQHISTSSLQAEETPTFPNVSPAANVSAFSTSDAETIELVDSAVETDRLSVAIKAVVIMKEGPKTYFIQQLANNDKLKLICEEVVKSPSLPLMKPEVGMLCAAMFEGEWYRARVLLLDPQLAVQYIDYGNIDICDPARLHELPQSIVDFPPMAEKIEFVDETQELSDGCIISVMPTGETENGVMKVRFDDGKKAFFTHVASSVPPQSDSTAKESQQASAASVQVSTSQAETSKSVVTPSCADNLSPVATLLQVVCASSASVEIPNEEKAFAKAKITVLNDSMDYWVTWEHNLETVDKIILKTNENITSAPLENPEVGLLCAAKFDGIWFRAHIVKISPEVQVHYLDYGNYEICTNNDLRDLPEALKDLPPMAFRVQLAEGTPQEYHSLLPEEFLSIRVVEQREAGVSVVQVEGVKYAGGVTADMLPAATNTVPSSVPSSSQENVTSIPSTTNAQVEKSTIPKSPHCEPSANSSANVPVNMINAPKFYDVRVAVTVGDKDYWVQRVNRDKELQFVMVQVNDYASKCIRMTPEVGKLCATEFLGLWYRARITKVAPEVEVHFIDFGNTEIRKKDEILEMPESVQEVSPLALRIRLADGTPAKFSNLQVDSIISVKPFMKTSDSVIVLVEGVEYAMDSEETTSQDVTSTVCASLEKQPEPGSSKTEQVFTLK